MMIFMMKRRSLLSPTIILVTVNVLVYICTSLVGGSFIETDYEVMRTFGQHNLNVFEGQYWQLISSMFVHADIIHLGLNMLFLLIFGLRVEELFTSEEYFFVYMISGIAGNIMTLFLMSLYTVSVGASGAIFGMYGAGLIYMRKTFGQSIARALLYAFLLLMLSTGTGVNIVAHFGGLAAGLIIGYVLAKSRQDKYWIESY